MSPTEMIAQFVIDTQARDIPKQAFETAKLVILDALGAILAASAHPAAQIVTEYVRDFEAAPRAGVIGTKVRTAPALAALANGTMAFILDFDDDLHGSVHTLPAALGIGEEMSINGEQLLEAYILGREVCFRLDAALDAGRKKNLGGPTSRGWFAGGTTGSLAAAAAAGKVLGLNVSQMRMALGIAASFAGGLRRNFGTMSKALQGGSAARNGVTAALLAQKGFTADDSILEAPHGFISALCLEGECDWQALSQNLGQSFYMERLPAIKRYPTCTPSHCPIDAVMALRQEHRFTAEDIESVECDFHGRSMCRPDPQEAMAGHNSMPFILALAILEGRVVVEQFTDEKVRDPLVRAVMSKIKHVPLPRSIGQPEPPDRLTVRLKNGAVCSMEVAERKTLTTKSEIQRKYMDCATMALRPGDAERLCDMVDELEATENVSLMMNLMTGNHVKSA
jgi:2-methylcitrate dehydratase PrpD